eukprot:2593865-Prorocentrum_lima.AAC.1
MTSSLVGSEMCIRDSSLVVAPFCPCLKTSLVDWKATAADGWATGQERTCLLYTSDAADDM